MNLISIIISVVLTGLMLSVGVFYGGSTYTDSKIEIDAIKIIDISEKMKTSVKIAESRDIDLTGDSDYPSEPSNLPLPPDIVKRTPLDIMLENGVISEIPKIYKGGEQSKQDFELLKTFESGSLINVMKVDIGEDRLCSKINEIISGNPSISKIDNTFYDGMPSFLNGYGIILMTDGGHITNMNASRNYTGKCFENDGGVFSTKHKYLFISIFDSSMANRDLKSVNIDQPEQENPPERYL